MSQELRMLSSVTLNCQVTMIVMNSGSQSSELQSVSQMSQVSKTVFSKLSKIVSVVKNYWQNYSLLEQPVDSFINSLMKISTGCSSEMLI